MAKGKATITHLPDAINVISETDSEGKKVVYLRFTGPLLGRINIEGDVRLQFELSLGRVIDLIFDLQKASAWFHKFLTEEELKRVDEAIRATDEANQGQVVSGQGPSDRFAGGKP